MKMNYSKCLSSQDELDRNWLDEHEIDLFDASEKFPAPGVVIRNGPCALGILLQRTTSISISK